MIEAAAGATIAAAMSEKMKQMDPKMKNIGTIVCRGNVDIDSLPWYTHSWSNNTVIGPFIQL